MNTVTILLSSSSYSFAAPDFFLPTATIPKPLSKLCFPTYRSTTLPKSSFPAPSFVSRCILSLFSFPFASYFLPSEIHSLISFKNILINWLEREREGERHQLVPITYGFIGWFLHAPWPGIKPATLAYGDNTLSNRTTTQPGTRSLISYANLSSHFSCLLSLSSSFFFFFFFYNTKAKPREWGIGDSIVREIPLPGVGRRTEKSCQLLIIQ